MPSLAKDKLGLKAEVFRAMGNPIRLGIIEFLETAEQDFSDIVKSVGTERSNVAKHLSILKKTGIVVSRREAAKTIYRIAMPCALDFSRRLEGVILGRLEHSMVA